MRLKDLEQIIHIKAEVDSLCRRLEKASGGEYVADFAKDYSSGYERIIAIAGYAAPDKNKVNKLLPVLLKRRAELEEKLVEAEQFVASVQDGKMRSLLTLRFMEGLDWEAVAKRTYKKMSASSARKAVKAFFGGSD